MRKLYYLLVFSLMWLPNYAQIKFCLDVQHVPLPKELIFLSENKGQSYSAQQWQLLRQQWQQNAIEAGYFLFDLWQVKQTDSLLTFQAVPGPFFQGIYLRDSSEHKPISPSQLKRMVQDSLSWYLNNGYPFAQIQLAYQSGLKPTVELHVEKGLYVNWGQFIVRPEGIIQQKALQQMLPLKEGEPFCLAALKQIQGSFFGQLPFKILRQPEWEYHDNKADVYFYLERVRASSATGIVGLQPNPLTQKTALVGELNIQLQNNWQKNEKLQLHWRSIAPQTQQLKTSLQWPYIAGSPYGLNTGLTIYKRDTAFLEMRTNFGVCYQFAGGWQLSAQLDYWRSNALKDLPGSEVATFRTTTYGLVLQRQKLDRIQNPTKGMLFQTSYLVGNRLTSEKVLTWRFTLAQRYFLSLAQRQVLCFTQQFDHIATPILYRNELYRFGGLDRMRGFDEEAFFASTVLLTGLEYRFLLDENSYALAFSDWAWSANQVQPAQKQQLYAFGMGLVLGTENGQFKLNYALGATIGEGLKLNAGKIHLGYISYF